MTPHALHFTLHALTLHTSRLTLHALTPMNQIDQFNVKCGDQTPNFTPKISLEERVKSVYKWFMKKDIDEINNAQVLSGSG